VTRSRPLLSIQRAIRWDIQADQEEIDDVEDEDTPDDLLRSSGDFLSRVDGLGSSKTRELGTHVGEGCADEDAAKALKAVKETGPWRAPVSCADVTSVVGRDAAAVSDYTEEDEADAGDDLHQTEHKFNLLFTLSDLCVAFQG